MSKNLKAISQREPKPFKVKALKITKTSKPEKNTTPKSLTKKDIICLIDLQTDQKLTLEEKCSKASNILKEISNSSKEVDEISVSSFISNVISNKTMLINSEHKDFYMNTLQFLLTPSEQIKDILSKAKNWTNGNNELKIGLDWVAQTITNSNIFNFQLKWNKEEPSSSINDYMKILSKYSLEKLKSQKMHDIEITEQIKEKRRSFVFTKLPNDVTLVSHYFNELMTINSIDFNIFDFKRELNINKNSKLLYLITNFIFEDWDLLNGIINKSKLGNFTKRVANKYKDNPYHNATHACDVLQTAMIMLRNGNFKENELLDDLDIASTFVACWIHDIGHPGTSNFYQINKGTKIALRYNDISPLENMHCYKGFKILSNEECDIFTDLKAEEKKIIRRRIIEMILHTDGANHSKVINTVKSKLEKVNKEEKEKESENEMNDSNNISVCSYDNVIVGKMLRDETTNSKFETQQGILNLIIHAADISNPTKTFELCQQWAQFVMEEFYNEGDLEREEGLPINNFCDRKITLISKCQIGFINFMVLPTFKLINDIIPGSQVYIDNWNANEKKWKEILSKDSLATKQSN